jgi:hypothetical protein
MKANKERGEDREGDREGRRHLWDVTAGGAGREEGVHGVGRRRPEVLVLG